MIPVARECWDWHTAVCTVQWMHRVYNCYGRKQYLWLCCKFVGICLFYPIHFESFFLRENLFFLGKNPWRSNVPKIFCATGVRGEEKILLRESLQHQLNPYWTDKGKGCYKYPTHQSLFRQNSWPIWQHMRQIHGNQAPSTPLLTRFLVLMLAVRIWHSFCK